MKKLLIGLIALLPVPVFAHGKWLVARYEDVIAAQHGTYQWYSLTSPEVLVWIVVCGVALGVAAYLHRVIPDWRALSVFARTYRGIIDKVAQAVLGIFLVATALFWHVIIVPTEVIDTPLLITLQWIEILIGLMLITHLYTRVAAAALFVLTFVVAVSNGFEAVLENVILLSLAAYFYLAHSPVRGIAAVAQKYSIDIVRIGTGISLIALACTEKLLYTELGMQFLAEHHWNFMMPLLPWFSNELFVLSTGFAELLFGLVFIFGYVTRINTLVIALFFLASVTTMYVQASVWEVEDFVVYCSAVLLFFFSHGHTTLPELLRKIRTGTL